MHGETIKFPKKVFLQQSNEPSHGPSTASMKSRTMLQVLNYLLHVCAQMHSSICMNVHSHAGWVGGWMCGGMDGCTRRVRKVRLHHV